MSILFKAVERARKAHTAFGKQPDAEIMENCDNDAPYQYDENDFYEGPAFSKNSEIDNEYEDGIEYQSSYSVKEEADNSFSNFLMFIMSLGVLTAMAVISVGAFIFKDEIAKRFSSLDNVIASKKTDNDTKVAFSKNDRPHAKLISFSSDQKKEAKPGFTRNNNSNYENLLAAKNSTNNSFETASITPVPATLNKQNLAFSQQIAEAKSNYNSTGYQIASSNQYGRVLPPIQREPSPYKRYAPVRQIPSSATSASFTTNGVPQDAMASGRFYMKMDNVPHVIPSIKPIEKIAQAIREYNQSVVDFQSQQIAENTTRIYKPREILQKPVPAPISTISVADKSIVYPERQTYSPREEIVANSNHNKQFENNPDFIQIAKADGLGHIPVSNTRISKARLVERSDNTTANSIRIYRENEDTKNNNHVQVTTFSPNSKSSLNRGYNSLVNGEYKKAISFYDQVIKSEPTNTYALLGKASALHKMGKKLEARLEYETILQRDPTNREALANLLGLLSDDAPEDALREMLELSKQYPDYAPIAAQIGLLHAARGSDPQSLVYLERARRLAPSNLSYMYNYAIMLDNTERWEAAAEMYKELVYAAEKSHAGHNIPVAQVKKRLKFLTSADEKEAEFEEEQQIGMLSINRMKKSDN
ncbi:MAG: tetratricopeptide repeat protein [Alphaproteobacteria bacterium]|nr:tetratricopeptide repeat protein [Alphaproteobacteria bacterium]